MKKTNGEVCRIKYENIKINALNDLHKAGLEVECDADAQEVIVYRPRMKIKGENFMYCEVCELWLQCNKNKPRCVFDNAEFV